MKNLQNDLPAQATMYQHLRRAAQVGTCPMCGSIRKPATATDGTPGVWCEKCGDLQPRLTRPTQESAK